MKLHFKLPTRYNDNTRIDKAEFVKVKKYFMQTCGGLSIETRQWVIGWIQVLDSSVGFKDTTIEYMVLIEKKRFEKQVKSKKIFQDSKSNSNS